MNSKKIFSGKVSSIVIALIACALWGSLFPFIKIGYSAFEIDGKNIPAIILFAGMRFLVSGIVMIAMFSVKEKGLLMPQKKDITPILLVSLCTIILHYVFTYMALAVGEGSKSAIVKQVGFLFLSCFSFIFVKDDLFSWKKLLCGILGFCGIIVTSLDGGGFSFAVGDALLIISSFCFVAGTVATKRYVNRISPLTIVSYSQLFGGAILCITGVCLGGRILHIDFRTFTVFAYIVAASIVAYVLWNVLLKYNSVSKLSIIKFAEPLFAVIFSGLLLKEDILKINYLIALLIIAVAILLSNVSSFGRKEKSGSSSNSGGES